MTDSASITSLVSLGFLKDLRARLDTESGLCHLDISVSVNLKKNTMKTTATADLSPPGDYGNLHLLSTREFIRPATLEEYTAAWLADFGWILTVDGLTCYLQF